jgi:hypothetical protein
VWSHSEANGSAWENRNLGSIDTYRSCTIRLQKTAYLHLENSLPKYTKEGELRQSEAGADTDSVRIEPGLGPSSAVTVTREGNLVTMTTLLKEA